MTTTVMTALKATMEGLPVSCFNLERAQTTTNCGTERHGYPNGFQKLQPVMHLIGNGAPSNDSQANRATHYDCDAIDSITFPIRFATTVQAN